MKWLKLTLWAVMFSLISVVVVRAQDEGDKNNKQDGEEEMSQEKAQKLFKECLQLHEKEKKYEKAIEGFKKVFKAFSDDQIGIASAYNVACGYALLDKKDEALNWLETSVKHGYSDVKHMEEDADLDSLREEARYKKIVKKLEKENEKEDE